LKKGICNGYLQLIAVVSSMLAWFVTLKEIYWKFRKIGVLFTSVGQILVNDVMPFVMLVLLPLIMIFSVAMYGLWPHTIFADRTDFDSKRWASIFSVFENMLVPSIVGELPELTEDGTLRIAAHYYFDWQSYELATENGADYSFSKVQEVILTLAMLVLNIFYSVMFALLLVNLLIAMMNETYTATMAEAELDWRVSYAAYLIRYEQTYMYCLGRILGSRRIQSWVRVGKQTLDGDYFLEYRVVGGRDLFDDAKSDEAHQKLLDQKDTLLAQKDVMIEQLRKQVQVLQGEATTDRTSTGGDGATTDDVKVKTPSLPSTPRLLLAELMKGGEATPTGDAKA